MWAICRRGSERDRLNALIEAGAELEVSAVAWYEFCRGPRLPQEIAVARCLFAEDGVVPLSEELALQAADVFRSLGSPRRRAGDVAIGVTAAALGARLLTRNSRDFEAIPGLQLEPPSTSSSPSP